MRTINIGNLNKRITFQRLQNVEDEMGQEKQELADYKTVWASLYPVRGAEYYEAAKLRSKVTYKCYVRYIPNITTNMYIKHGGKTYTIESVVDVDLEHKMLEIYCTEYTNNEVIADAGHAFGEY